MTQPFLGEIRMFGGTFAPAGWARCDGQILSITQNTALFSLFGTIYGGDGRNTFGLPDLRGRVPIHEGTGPSLSQRNLGSKGGEEMVALAGTEVAAHSHTLQAADDTNTVTDPTGRVLGQQAKNVYREPADNSVALDPAAIGATGDGVAHENLMPFLCVNFIVALTGNTP